jgi:hypothetical protein
VRVPELVAGRAEKTTGEMDCWNAEHMAADCRGCVLARSILIKDARQNYQNSNKFSFVHILSSLMNRI